MRAATGFLSALLLSWPGWLAWPGWASIARGPCHQATRGQTVEEAFMDCSNDGTCEESLRIEICDCSGDATYLAGRLNFQNGTKSWGVGQTVGELGAENNLPRRCDGCL